MEAVWKTPMNQHAVLMHDLNTQVLIIGGGMTGMLCAHRLKAAGFDVVLIEADTIGSGVTSGTTAKVTAQHGLVYHRIASRFGMEAARLYRQANQQAVADYRRMSRELACDYEVRDNVIYRVDDDAEVLRELATLQALGVPAERVGSLPLPFATAGAIRMADQGQFHPLAFLSGLSKGLHIYEHTRALVIHGSTVLTEGGQVTARWIIMATHFPLMRLQGAFALKLYQHRGYGISLRNAWLPEAMYADDVAGGLSFRSRGEELLLVGGGGRTGKPCDGWAALRRFAAKNYPQAEETGHWAAQDCMTLDDLPYVGRCSPGSEHLLVATGFNKWGMTSAMVAAALLTDMVMGRENPCEQLLTPSRSMMRTQLAVNAATSAGHLLMPTMPRCPHLGCALKWNEQERSWDCPCHGSRFAEDGRVLEAPAVHGISPGQRPAPS